MVEDFSHSSVVIYISITYVTCESENFEHCNAVKRKIKREPLLEDAYLSWIIGFRDANVSMAPVHRAIVLSEEQCLYFVGRHDLGGQSERKCNLWICK